MKENLTLFDIDEAQKAFEKNHVLKLLKSEYKHSKFSRRRSMSECIKLEGSCLVDMNESQYRCLYPIIELSLSESINTGSMRYSLSKDSHLYWTIEYKEDKCELSYICIIQKEDFEKFKNFCLNKI